MLKGLPFMQFQSVDVSDKAKWYETRRNELLKLLELTSEMEIQEKYARELELIRKKCLEDQFEIVLVGEFQGGKSTTFNALCDGRDLSPRGLGGGGIKTSAAIISAQNISDGETKDGREEWAEITFKTKYEIQKGMFDLLHEDFVEEAVNNKALFKTFNLSEDDLRQKMSISETFAEILDLDLPAHRNAVKKIIQMYWAQWQQSPASLDEDTKDRLHIATLQERFYGTPEYREMVSKTVVGLDEFQPMIAFPWNWIIRWQEEGSNASFTLKEAAFVFIARTLLRIKSDNLAKVGCRITDCPGLFANAYDTSVAQLAISNSDAVWYLIGGEKQIGEKDLRSLDFIKSMGGISKVTASVNLKGKHEKIMTQIFPVTKATLQAHGFDFPVLKYNAKLAFLATQGKRIQEGEKFSDYETNCMRVDSDNGEDTSVPVDEMWINLVNEAGVQTGLKALKSLDEVSEESVQTVMTASNIDEILSFLNQEIITKKSKSILIDNGSKRAADALQEYEGQLKMSEDAAIQDETTWKQKVEEGKKALEHFIAESESIIEDSALRCDKGLLSKALALDLIRKSFNDKCIDQIADIIAEVTLSLKKDFFLFPDNYRNAVMQKASPQIYLMTMNSIQNTLESWKSNKTVATDSWQSFQNNLNRILKQIKKLWKDQFEAYDYISCIPLHIPEEDDEVINQLTEMQMFLWGNEEIQKFLEDNRFGVFALISYLPEQLWEGAKKIYNWITDGKSPTRKDIIKKDILKHIQNLKSEDFRLKASQCYVRCFIELHENILKKLSASLADLLTNFENEYVVPAKRNLTESEQRRKEIAETNRKIRTEQIEPLRKTIRAFERQVTRELNLE